MGLQPKDQVRSNLHVLQSSAIENGLMSFILTSILTEAEHYQSLMEELDAILRVLAEEIEEEN